ncbi:MAG: hypothetical protein HQL56_09750 [Magnetococcales bacterium]|nr:hypothetical protein [Magnetococcales bacterium]
MSTSFVINLNDGKASQSENQLMGRIKQSANKVPKAMEGKTFEATGMVASRAKGFAAEAVKIDISDRSVEKGRIVPAPPK